MAWNSRDGAPYSLRTILKQLDDRGIELPDTVTDKVARLARIEAERPAEPEHTALRDAILAGADRAELDGLLLDELGSQRLRSSYAQAILTAASSALSALRKARDEIHPRLAELADDAITKLRRIEALGSVSLDQLVRTGRHEEARLRRPRANRRRAAHPLRNQGSVSRARRRRRPQRRTLQLRPVARSDHGLKPLARPDCQRELHPRAARRWCALVPQPRRSRRGGWAAL